MQSTTEVYIVFSLSTVTCIILPWNADVRVTFLIIYVDFIYNESSNYEQIAFRNPVRTSNRDVHVELSIKCPYLSVELHRSYEQTINLL